MLGERDLTKGAALTNARGTMATNLVTNARRLAMLAWRVTVTLKRSNWAECYVRARAEIAGCPNANVTT